MTWIVAITDGGLVWKIIRWTTKVDAAVDGFSDFVKEIRDDMKEIRSNITEVMLRLPPKPVAGSSPLRLTDFGERMADFMDAKTWTAQLAKDLLTDTAGMEDFEVDAYSRGHVQQLHEKDPGLQKRVAACAYQFGTKTEGVLDVLQVVLRDALLRGRAQDQSQPPSLE